MKIFASAGPVLARRAALALGAAAISPAIKRSEAQTSNYPTRPVKIVVPYTPGGFTDLSARLVAESLSKVLGQPVVVENRPGANSILGAGLVASSAPDGYTFLMVLPAHAANATLQAGKLPFDPVSSFAPVSLVATSPLVLASGKRMPATLREFIDYARAREGAISYGSSGIGSTAHLAMELLQIRTGLKMMHVPYRGTQPALQDLMAGNIGAMFDVNSAMGAQFEAGNIRALGVASAERVSFAPSIPTFAEQGVADFTASTWSMLLAPAGTPKPIMDRVSSEVSKIIREPAMVAKLREMGLLAEGRGPEETGEFLNSEVTRWASVIRTGGVTVE
ncbi:tripartite tricarboxylate transporter substrate binding protein [Roseomonas xinghualingensis]|uniref:tripartite tricarboxylate transporter substrate binding protein n=1 Tax=Roseomonas xinghualingensis TaxID=2986475 RepID=UPI0021F19C04|nr:tripartite tricarboxylate transporter substrate binding protein [Roseomonas sp. SXEYE001]MCV4206955.1 tripartite tricarboxylate transporter substrate binding protein [Roseomonas sp. SXEYE001]